ncbi:MAG: hypothetical protein ACRC1L_03780 [Prochlorococcaceae cyanobacterium]
MRRRCGLATVASTIASERATNLFLRTQDGAELARLRSSKDDWRAPEALVHGAASHGMSANSLPGEQGGKQNLPATLAAGLTVGSLSAFAQISFGALLFSGSLSGGMGEGVSHTLLGGVLIGSVMALWGSFPGTVARPHELPVIVLALLAAQLAHRLPSAAPGADVLATVTVLIMVSTAVFGLTALLLGRWGAGNLFRYLPFPVLGGFVAGTGGLLVK